jgi:hypothetical protein
MRYCVLSLVAAVSACAPRPPASLEVPLAPLATVVVAPSEASQPARSLDDHSAEMEARLVALQVAVKKLRR